MPISDATAGAANTDTAFVPRIKGALVKACPAIQNEAGGTTNHQARLQLVGRILRDQDGYAARFAPFVAVDATIITLANLAAATDAQLETATNALLDLFALQGV